MTSPNGQARGRQIRPESSPKRAHPSRGIQGPHDAPQEPQTLRADQLLTAQQLAERWQVPKQHVYRLTRRAEIPYVRLGKYVRYRRAAIEQWEQDQE